MPRILFCRDDRLLAGVFGFYRQAVVVPFSFADSFSCEEREAFLRHEFQHVYKRDVIWLFVQKLIRNLFWIHPLVWWLDRQISAEREILRDEEVIRKTENVTSYLNCLVKASTIKLPRSYATGVGIKGSLFARRIKAISRIKSSRFGDFLTGVGSITAMTAIGLFLSASLSLSQLQAADIDDETHVSKVEQQPALSDAEKNALKEIMLVVEEDKEKALDLIYEVITEDSSAAFEFFAGNLHAELGRTGKGIQFYQAALDKYPNFRRAARNLGIYLAK